MSGTTRKFIEENVSEYSKLQGVELTEKEQEQVVDKLMEDQELWDFVSQSISNQVHEVVVSRNR